MIRLLLDQGLPRSGAAILRDKGYDVIHVAEVGLRDAKDIEIIHYAREQSRIVVTLDADFHALLKVGGHSRPSVIRLRMEGLRGKQLADLVAQVLETVDQDVRQGALVTVNAKTILFTAYNSGSSGQWFPWSILDFSLRPLRSQASSRAGVR